MIVMAVPSLRHAWSSLLALTARRVACVVPSVRRRYEAEQDAKAERLLASLREDEQAEADEDAVSEWMDEQGFRVGAITSDGISEADEVAMAALVQAVNDSEQMAALKARCHNLHVEFHIYGLDGSGDDDVD